MLSKVAMGIGLTIAIVVFFMPWVLPWSPRTAMPSSRGILKQPHVVWLSAVAEIGGDDCYMKLQALWSDGKRTLENVRSLTIPDVANVPERMRYCFPDGKPYSFEIMEEAAIWTGDPPPSGTPYCSTLHRIRNITSQYIHLSNERHREDEAYHTLWEVDAPYLPRTKLWAKSDSVVVCGSPYSQHGYIIVNIDRDDTIGVRSTT